MLLNKILTGSHGLRIAVIENEFSEGLGIEGMIAKSGVNGDNISNFFELNNGCVSFMFAAPFFSRYFYASMNADLLHCQGQPSEYIGTIGSSPRQVRLHCHRNHRNG